MTKIQQVILFINYFSLGLIIPILNLILLEKGASLQTLPILMALYAVTVLCFELPSGICADIFGRKTVFLISCGFQLLSLFLLLIANNMLLLIFAIIFNGLSRAFSSGSLDALIIDQAIARDGEECLAKVTSRLAILDGGGIAIGCIAAGIISSVSGSYLVNLVLRSLLIAIVLILCQFYIKETIAHQDKEEHISLPVHLKQGKEVIFSTPQFGFILSSVFCVGFLLITVETYWQPAFLGITSLKNSTWLLGIISFLGFIAMVAGNTLSEKLLEKFKKKQWLIFNVSRMILSLVLISLAMQQRTAGFILGYTLIYAIMGAGNVAESTLINQITPNHLRASVLSLHSFLSQLGVMCASVLSSIIIVRLQINGVWIVAGILLGGCTVVVSFLTYRRKTEETVRLNCDE